MRDITFSKNDIRSEKASKTSWEAPMGDSFEMLSYHDGLGVSCDTDFGVDRARGR